MRDTVFITGASGFVGSAVLRKLVDSGFMVRALVRRGSPRAHLPSLGVKFIEGDLCNRDSIRTAMAGARFVFHVAADYRLWARDPGEVFFTNVEGTRIVMEEAIASGVERVVHTSSVATVALRETGEPAAEDGVACEEKAVGAYKRGKIASERVVMEMVKERGLPAVVVNPSTPIGMRDVRPTPTGRIIIEAACGRIPAFVDTGLNLVHVDDVAEGQLAALARGQIGERYILGGQNVAFSQMLADIAQIVGRRPPSISLPWYSTLPIAYASEAIAFMTGREPLATVAGVHLARRRMYFDATKAERELGLIARPYGKGLEDAVRWFHDAGYLARRGAAPLLALSKSHGTTLR